MFGVAGLYVYLNSPFLAMMQILIYVGAVTVLIAFAVMLIGPLYQSPKEWTTLGKFGAAVGVAVVSLGHVRQVRHGDLPERQGPRFHHNDKTDRGAVFPGSGASLRTDLALDRGRHPGRHHARPFRTGETDDRFFLQPSPRLSLRRPVSPGERDRSASCTGGP